MKKIAILGSGGFAREVFYLIHDINKANPVYEVIGFVDAFKTGSVSVNGKEIRIYSEDEMQKMTGISIAVGIGDPKVIRKVTDKFKDFEFPNLIHPSATGYFETMKMTSGNIVTAGCRFTLDIRIDSFNIFNLNTTVGHDTIIGSCNVFNPGVNLSGGVKIGNENLVGTNATILQNIAMGSGSILGASALLTKELGDNQLAVGVPAKAVVRGT